MATESEKHTLRKGSGPSVLVTGAAGFIGYHASQTFLSKGMRVIGLDNFNPYYDVTLKEARLAEIRKNPRADSFQFINADLCDAEKISRIFAQERFDVVVHLAAQPGVRYSLTNPHVYIKANVEAFLNILEGCRNTQVKNLIFASSSSVYGMNEKLPYSEDDSVDHPISLYAATKKSNELMAHTYAHLFGVPCTGLRFFTVYGPWGRPDMAVFKFAEAIWEGRPLSIYNNGNMKRDFTYVTDIVEGLVKLCYQPAAASLSWNPSEPVASASSAPYRVFNIGNHSPVLVKDLVALLEKCIGKKAVVINEPVQPGDVMATYADVEKLSALVGFRPSTNIEEGIALFAAWYKDYKLGSLGLTGQVSAAQKREGQIDVSQRN